MLTCTDHSFERGREYRPVVRGTPLSAVSEALDWFSRQKPSDVTYAQAAPMEDLLHEASIMLADSRTARRAARLLIVGGRLPHPYPQGSGRIMRCPLKYKWRQSLQLLTGEAGALAWRWPTPSRPMAPRPRSGQKRRPGRAAPAARRHGPTRGRGSRAPRHARAADTDSPARSGMRPLVTTPSRTASRRNRALKSIGLWGATQCGKTTFLASLYIAVNRSSQSLNIFGADDTSTEFLVESNRMLTKDHRFPEGTLAVNSYSWTMNMTQVVQEERTRFGQTTPPVTESSQFNIDMRDAPGGFFDSLPMTPQGQSRLDLGDGSPDDDADDPDDMLDHLARCEGILLLIDPVGAAGGRCPRVLPGHAAQDRAAADGAHAARFQLPHTWRSASPNSTIRRFTGSRA